MAVSEEMVERGMRALHEVSTYRGYNQETLDREWSRMERIYRAHVTAILTAALSDRVMTASPAQDVMDHINKQFGFAWDLNEAICDAIDAGVTESRAIAARVTTDPRIKAWLPSMPVPASTPVRSS